MHFRVSSRDDEFCVPGENEMMNAWLIVRADLEKMQRVERVGQVDESLDRAVEAKIFFIGAFHRQGCW